MDLNEITLTGRVMQTTKKADKNGVVMVLGTVGVFKGKDKQTGSPLYSNIPFVAYNQVADFIKPDSKMLLHGRLNSYIKQDGSQYGQLVVQIQVLSAYPIATPDKQAIKEHPSTGLDMGAIDEAVDEITIKDSDLPF
ncbi:hypothetical protein C6Y12_05010 [Lactiplantibacillus pentosus]|uniref:hypothetical protein n=1 Tax=Lactiplantibacillus pentosus TaxID=1589 RepID=UPI000D020760|nr:hypothetical protein [Lactiplantibacillus pentosus]MCT3301790.1 hypothetical protein [Lactiplantibacillus pentosus]PRO81347.1 hypothetical protein C6Y09_06710 [Lactiplantibacillus pentosus]PRO92582.1 hypothetical protein C6Y12_05010 [Lactiplantibacillus pentosus]